MLKSSHTKNGDFQLPILLFLGMFQFHPISVGKFFPLVGSSLALAKVFT